MAVFIPVLCPDCHHSDMIKQVNEPLLNTINPEKVELEILLMESEEEKEIAPR